MILAKKSRGILPVSSWKLLTRSREELAIWERAWLCVTNGLQLFGDGVKRYGVFETIRKSFHSIRRVVSNGSR
jgi:hypothetical protein